MIYRDLIKGGWSYKDIEEMDIHGFLRLMETENGERKDKFDDIEAFYNSI